MDKLLKQIKAFKEPIQKEIEELEFKINSNRLKIAELEAFKGRPSIVAKNKETIQKLINENNTMIIDIEYLKKDLVSSKEIDNFIEELSPFRSKKNDLKSEAYKKEAVLIEKLKKEYFEAKKEIWKDFEEYDDRLSILCNELGIQNY